MGEICSCSKKDYNTFEYIQISRDGGFYDMQPFDIVECKIIDVSDSYFF